MVLVVTRGVSLTIRRHRRRRRQSIIVFLGVRHVAKNVALSPSCAVEIRRGKFVAWGRVSVSVGNDSEVVNVGLARLILPTISDLDEMWRRIEGMIEAETGPFAGARMADLGDIRLVDLVGENSVLGLLTQGIIEPTPMYDALDAYIAEFKPGLVELDVLADLFSGEENNRPQVTQFIGLLKRLCRKHHCATLLLAQPSVAGMNTGSGTSGSTGWSNSGRSRLYFQRVKTDEGGEPNKNLRTFEGKKANYSEVGGKFDVEWKDGLFRRVIGQTGFAKMAADQKAEDLFVSQLASFAKSGRSVSDSPGANYAPTKFASDKPTQELLKLAMFRLFDKGTIKIEPGGAPSRPTKRIVLA
jgi:AAA domain